MNKTRIVGIIGVLLLLSIGLVGAIVLNTNKDQGTHSQQNTSDGLSNEEIRNALINHGVDHKEGQN